MIKTAPIIPPYLRDPQAIYAESFRQISALVDLSPFPSALHPALMRLVHSCGRPEILNAVHYSQGWHDGTALAKLSKLKHIFTDSEMTRAGIIQKSLPATMSLECTLRDSKTSEHAKKMHITRSAAAVDGWLASDDTAMAVIGNAPTALFRLLENIQQGRFKPLLIIAFPVGFVGAAEAKACLIEAENNFWNCDWISLSGREGGSGLASSVVNGLLLPAFESGILP